ncbi:hypothetical protein ACP4OV_010246 [Aristida adscensionis]
MAQSVAAPVEFGPTMVTLGLELLQALTAGDDRARLAEVLSRGGPTTTSAGHVAINVGAAASAPPPPTRVGAGGGCLLGVTSNGNTALHLVASRGHGELVALVCERAPSLVATRNRCLDTPLHCAARGGHGAAVACLLRTMRAAGGEGAAALRATNRLGATALCEAVRDRRAGVVALVMAEMPELASVTTDDGVSPLYLAAAAHSPEMVRELLKPSQNGTPSPASFSGPKGQTALHAAAVSSKEVQLIATSAPSFCDGLHADFPPEMVREILDWKPEGPTLMTKVDSAGRTPLHYAIAYKEPEIAELLLAAHVELAHICDNRGLFPLHFAAMAGSTRIIDELVKICPDYYEMVDGEGMFAMLLNAKDFEGNTPLHLAVNYGYPRIVSLLLQTISVKTAIMNKDGLTPMDLAYKKLESGSIYFLDPHGIVFQCLYWSRAEGTLQFLDVFPTKEEEEVKKKNKSKKNEQEEEEDKASKDLDGITKTGTVGSVLIATMAFTAAFTVPGGFVADDHPGAGTATLARRFAFRAFMVSAAVAFLSSIIATAFHIYGGTKEIPRGHRIRYTSLASGLVPVATQFIIAAFAFGVHLVVGDGANSGLLVFVYLVSSASVLCCFPSIWLPLYFGLGRAIWRRAGLRGLANTHSGRSMSLVLHCFIYSFLFSNIRRLLPALLICSTFVLAIALELAMPEF